MKQKQDMNRSVLITGSSTGLGLDMALYLAERGFEVFASMRDLERRSDLEEMAANRNVHLHVLKLDITDRNDINEAVRRIVEETGGIYGLVNNGGIGLRGYFEDQSEEEIRQVFEANVFGTMEMTRAVLPHMRNARRGRILIITSVGGLVASLAVSTYCSTKFAQEGFGEALAQELLPFGIYVSLIEPAIIKTERWGVNRNVGRGALNPESPYYEWFLESERLADRLVETSGAKSVQVAQAAYKALTARRPRLRYMVGRRAGLVVALRRYLPGEWFQRVLVGEAVRRVTKVGGPVAKGARS